MTSFTEVQENIRERKFPSIQSISYPPDLLEKTNHFTHLTFFETQFQRLGDKDLRDFDLNKGFTELKEFAVEKFKNGLGKVKGKRESVIHIFLPLPKNIQEEYSQEITETQGLENLLSIPLRNSGDERQKTSSSFLGTSWNPLFLNIYERPDFRDYNFDWSFVPRNENESKILREITLLIKYFSAPLDLVNELFGVFEVPNLCRVNFLHKKDDGNYESIIEPQFKTSFLKNIKINFSENDTQTNFFHNVENNRGALNRTTTRHPNQINLSLSFKEVQFITKNSFLDNERYDSFIIGSDNILNVDDRITLEKVTLT